MYAGSLESMGEEQELLKVIAESNSLLLASCRHCRQTKSKYSRLRYYVRLKFEK